MRRELRKIVIVASIVMYSTSQLPLWAVRQVDPYLTDGEKKKLEKADEYNDDANIKVEEANAIYLQISELQAMESADQKKITKLEEKAVSLQIEALELNQKANEVEYNVYREKIDEFLKGYQGDETSLTYPKLLEEQANEEFYKANQLKSDAKNSDSQLDVYLKYLEAQEAELKGLEHQEKAIEAYMNVNTIAAITYEEPAVTYEQPVETVETYQPDNTGFGPPVQTQPEAYTYAPGPDTPKSGIVFDEYQIEIIRKLQNNEIPQGSDFNLQAWDMTTLQTAWDNYQLGITPAPETIPADVTDVTNITDVPADQTDQNTYNDNQAQTETYDYTDKNTYVPPSDETKDQTYHDGTTYIDQSTQPTDNNNDYTRDVSPTDIYSGSGIIYRVQIAADKHPLNQSTLRKIYYGNNTVEMISENGWYKYSIGDFNSYAEANTFRNGCGVYDAFIVAYKNGQKMDMASAKTTDREASYAPSGQIIFKVQIAATKNQLSNDEIIGIYNGFERVDLTQEEGWYKYSIGNMASYQQAVDLKAQSGVKDAFIVAYMNGRKLDLYQAMNKPSASVVRYAEIKPDNDIIFGVQIAASRAPITMNNLSLLYDGNKTIIETSSGGWFRYRVDIGKSFEEAKQFKEDCGIKGAFIVAHQNGERVKVKDAVNKNK
ncbi:MAG: hypothetical protein JXB49_18800 [Bacteroidales bacterium]|nr:hypothetical protein [Bacteroidales bacterium]